MSVSSSAVTDVQESTRYKILAAISLSHFLNDLLQSLIVAIYPILKGNYQLSFA